MSIYDISAQTIDGETCQLSAFQGKVMLIVNVASECGLTPHYKGLEKLYQDFKDQGLVVLGFPCNQFGAQEPGSEAEIKSFCERRYGVSFPLFAKIEVNGPDAHPLYQFLKKEQAGEGESSDIEWNFAKFLVDRDGRVVKRFHAKTEPENLVPSIEALLG